MMKQETNKPEIVEGSIIHAHTGCIIEEGTYTARELTCDERRRFRHKVRMSEIDPVTGGRYRIMMTVVSETTIGNYYVRVLNIRHSSKEFAQNSKGVMKNA